MMGTKLNPGQFDCFANAEPDEPYFVLLARDLDAPSLVRRWADTRLGAIKLGSKPKSDMPMVQEALDCADAMVRWRANHREEVTMTSFKRYRRKQIAEIRAYVPGETLSERISISAADREAGSPKAGDMIARNPKNHDDQWLIADDYFKEIFEEMKA